MNALIVVNDALDIHAGQTTTLLAMGLLRRGCRVHACGVTDLTLSPEGAVGAHARPAHLEGDRLRLGTSQHRPLSAVRQVLIRTNPGRDPGRPGLHETALRLLARAAAHGTVVRSDPAGLLRASSKLYLSELPESVRPRTLISRDQDHIRAFVHETGHCVLKPLSGSHGRDVFSVQPGDPNFNQIVEAISRGGFVMVQPYIPEASAGDTRVLLLEGTLLRVGSAAATVRRIPGGGDFRSNVHAGGRPAPGILTPRIREIVSVVGPQLVRDGIFLAGLDIIGGTIVEANVYSPGGLQDAGRFHGVDFVAPILDRLLAPL